MKLIKLLSIIGLTFGTNSTFATSAEKSGYENYKDHITHSGAWGLALIVIVLAYYLLARSEELKVEAEFGDEYREYRKRVPMFIPRWGQWRAMYHTQDEKSE